MAKPEQRSARDRARPARAVRPGLGVGLALLAVGVPIAVWWGLRSPSSGPGFGLAPRLGERTPAAPRSVVTQPAPSAAAEYAGSAACRECHAKAYEAWRGSHHALAERRLEGHVDYFAFVPERTFAHGSQTSEARLVGNRFELVTEGANGQRQPFAVERVIGVSPLRQYLVPWDGGRFQVTEVAVDPRNGEWFNIFGGEDRRAGEWGHWTGRGMTWNVMCAGCHNLHVTKGYDEARDTYDTRYVEHGVGCESCHGPMAAHVAWQRPRPQPPAEADPTVRRLSGREMFDTCGGCHARRSELTGTFRPGDSFFDHYGLSIPDETDLYYPDGQVRDEDFEFAAFRGSQMQAAGVLCVDCHDPHAGKPVVAGNDLCLRCHLGQKPPAPVIDPKTHSHHKLGEPGDRCVDCHMPITVYMARHPRHDHGFTIPDPRLTKEHGIPNACTRCHHDKPVDWSLEAAEKWYGDRLERPSRARTRWLARARAGEDAAVEPLLTLSRQETNAYWRAVSAGLLRRWIGQSNVVQGLVERTRDEDPMVRAIATRALEPWVNGGPANVVGAVERGLVDACRWVRIEAAWGMRRGLDLDSTAGRDLADFLAYNADQPGGALQQGVFNLDRGRLEVALGYFRKAVRWDRGSAAFRDALAVALSLEGRAMEAVRELEVACQLAPRDAEYRYKLGLAWGEVGRTADAAAALTEAVRLDPRYEQAWYNLGLAQSALGRWDDAVESLGRAESLNGRSPRIPYARATVLARAGRIPEARQAARRALELEPGFADAARLLGALDAR